MRDDFKMFTSVDADQKMQSKCTIKNSPLLQKFYPNTENEEFRSHLDRNKLEMEEGSVMCV